ncbi:MAG: hypothetical protein AB201_02930 [Parcubacteria bacterium C7867-006]|nr:MAG: hypothetical protein AB201_02930 [Parcubacteria bacterium C7867-006]
MNELFKKINSERMTDAEKQAGFKALQSFVMDNPIREPWYKKAGDKILSPFSNDMFLHHKILASAFVIVLLISATGGTSAVAKYSLPGDVLYPIKINLNERLETFTALTPEAKANIEATHIDERLSEAEMLSTQNKLDQTIRAQIENQFSQDLQSTMQRVKTLDTSGDKKSAKEVKIKLENSLQKHKDVVDEILKNRKQEQPKVKNVENNSLRAKTTPSEETQINNNVSTFSATMMIEATSTQQETETKTKIEHEDESEDNDTPLLNETLIRISYPKLENRD